MIGTTVGYIATVDGSSNVTFTVDFGDGTMTVDKYINIIDVINILTITNNYTATTDIPPVLQFPVQVETVGDFDSCNQSMSFTFIFYPQINTSDFTYPPVAALYEETEFELTSPCGNPPPELLIDFGDGMNETNSSLVTFGSNCAASLTHMYNATSLGLPLVVMAVNEVSGWSMENCKIGGEDRIRNLTLEGNNTIYWTPGYSLWTVGIGVNVRNLSDIVCNWTFGCPDNVQDQASSPVTLLSADTPLEFVHYFDRDDKYMQCLTMNCSNDISFWDETIPIKVILLSVKLTLSYLGPVWWNDTTQFVLNITNYGPGGCFEWDLDDGTVYSLVGSAPCSGVKLASKITETISLTPVPHLPI